MSWFTRHPNWLYRETRDLSNNSIYKEEHQRIGKILVSSGLIVIRKEKIRYQPILIAYPEGTPYTPPKVYILEKNLDEETVENISESPFREVDKHVKGKEKFIHKRHQNADGSVCFIETGDLHSERAELTGIRDILKRIEGWLADRPQKDSREVELFYHFPKRVSDLHFLLPDPFFNAIPVKGTFFARRLRSMSAPLDIAYIGIMLAGETAAGVSLLPEGWSRFLSDVMPSPEALLKEDEPTKKALEEKELIKGFWWDIDHELEPFGDISFLMRHLGNGNEDLGTAKFIGVPAMQGLLKKMEEDIYVGLRFPGRTEGKEWQVFRQKLKAGKDYPPILPWGDESYKGTIFGNYTVEAVRQEYFTDQRYHMRNKGRADRDQLKKQKLSVLGCGAIGSEAADALVKAGIGEILFVDSKNMQPHNAIRHVLGIQTSGIPKAAGLLFHMEYHNPFLTMNFRLANIFSESIDEYLPDGYVGLSSIADDNTEAYLNEQAILAGRAVFYCRALRGGKAARIFRVIPHVDACKYCLALYHVAGDPRFPKIEEDPELPEITNECNNPIRPASASDLKIVAGLASKILIEYFQGMHLDRNHWVWSTEPLPGIPLDGDNRGAIRSYSIPPHPACPTCQKLEDKKVYVRRDAYDFMKKECAGSKGVETGGVLIGYWASDGKYVVSIATGPGPKAIRKKTLFKRDVEYCQEAIDEAAVKLGAKGLYIGEWHFHTGDSNEPSGLDIKSLREIALQENYRIDNPIMIIFSGALECAITIHDKTGKCVKLSITLFEDDPSP